MSDGATRDEQGSAVVSFVSAAIPPEQVEPVRAAYEAAIHGGLPPGIRETYLLASEDGTMAVVTVWWSHDDLDVARSSPEEPLARRILREAGGTPTGSFFDVIAEARSS